MQSTFLLLVVFSTWSNFLVNVRGINTNLPCRKSLCNGQNFTNGYYSADCRCDPDCTMYEDCCIDSPYNVPRSTLSTLFECAELPLRKGVGIYMKRSCSLRKLYSLGRKKKCRSSKDYEEQVKDIDLKIPVSGPNGITYGNKYCAQCNEVFNFISWGISVTCGKRGKQYLNITAFSNSSEYTYNTSTKTWTFLDTNKNRTRNCIVMPLASRFMETKFYRKCKLNLTSTCPKSSKYFDMCQNYTSTVLSVKNSDKVYKNEDCALCNGINRSEIVCLKNYSGTIPRITIPTEVFKFTSLVTTVKPNTTNTISTKNREFLHIRTRFHCKDFLEYTELAKIVTETKFFSIMNRTRIKGIVPLKDYPTQMCETSFKKEENKFRESKSLQLLVNISISISIAFILSHFYYFIFAPNTTVIQKCTLSYAIALFIGNVAFVGGNMFRDNCNLFGFLTYYGFIASFFWITVLAFDVSFKIWSCILDLEVFNKNSNYVKKFYIYCVISWLVPLLVIFVVKYCENEIELMYYEPPHIYETCWFHLYSASLVLFSFPLVITMSLNMAFYLCSAYVVWVQPAAVEKLMTKYEIDFKFHTALILITNSMWALMLLAENKESAFFWILFAFSNILLGLAVYVSSPVKHTISIIIGNLMDLYCFRGKWNGFNKQT